MTVSKLTSPPNAQEEIDKINEIIDNLGGGGGGSVSIDNLSITENASNELQTVGVIDNRSGNAIKTWTGTKSQYDAIVTKDANTLYNITDDTDVTLTLLNALYPVGSIYIGTMNACPLAALGVGTWTLKSANAIVTSVNSTAPCKGNGMTLGLTNGVNNVSPACSSGYALYASANDFNKPVTTSITGGSYPQGTYGIVTDETKSGIEATVTSTSLTVNIWERVS